MSSKINFAKKIAGVSIAVSAVLAVQGCASFDEVLGMAKNAPDESQVITHEPLVKPQVATLPQPGDGVDNTIVPEPVDKSEQIKAELEEEKKRRIIHEGATPETRSQVQNKNPNLDIKAAPINDKKYKTTEKEPWWKIW